MPTKMNINPHCGFQVLMTEQEHSRSGWDVILDQFRGVCVTEDMRGKILWRHTIVYGISDALPSEVEREDTERRSS